MPYSRRAFRMFTHFYLSYIELRVMLFSVKLTVVLSPMYFIVYQISIAEDL